MAVRNGKGGPGVVLPPTPVGQNVIKGGFSPAQLASLAKVGVKPTGSSVNGLNPSLPGGMAPLPTPKGKKKSIPSLKGLNLVKKSKLKKMVTKAKTASPRKALKKSKVRKPVFT